MVTTIITLPNGITIETKEDAPVKAEKPEKAEKPKLKRKQRSYTRGKASHIEQMIMATDFFKNLQTKESVWDKLKREGFAMDGTQKQQKHGVYCALWNLSKKGMLERKGMGQFITAI